MASGIDWFRWHHGSVTDPKFQLVARKSGASLPDVLAVWAYLLEQASAAEFRGCFGDVDCEAIDCLFGFDDGKTDAILAQMVERKIIADAYIVSWRNASPSVSVKTTTAQSVPWRSAKGNAIKHIATPCNAKKRHLLMMQRHATPCNAKKRLEKRRVEKK